ncbi:MAG: hypothetical protein WAM97_15240 [Acidimicrobiales bacterium]
MGEIVKLTGWAKVVSDDVSAENVMPEGAMFVWYLTVPANDPLAVTVPGGVVAKKSAQVFTPVPVIVPVAFIVYSCGTGVPLPHGLPAALMVTVSDEAAPTVNSGGLNLIVASSIGHFVMPLPTTGGLTLDHFEFEWVTAAPAATGTTTMKVSNKVPATAARRIME